MQFFVVILVFCSVLLVLVGVYLLWTSRSSGFKSLVLERITLRESEASYPSDPRMGDVKGASRLERLCSPFVRLDLLAPLFSSIGMPLSPTGFLWLVLMSGVLAFAVSILITGSEIFAFLAAVTGFSVPFAYLKSRRRRAERKLVQQFPEALDFIVRALRAGQSLDRALQGVVWNFTEPMAGQIRFIYDEMSLGLPFSEALRRFESRFPRLTEVKIFCTALVIHRETGGNLTRILEVLSDNIRQRVRLASQLKASTAEVRVTALILGLLPFALLSVFYLLNPEYIQVLFVHPMGRKMLAFALCLEVIGFAVMRGMAKVDM